MRTTPNIVTITEQAAFDDPVVSPVAAALVTARAVQRHSSKIIAVFDNGPVVEGTLQYVSGLARYAVVSSMPSIGSSNAIERQLREGAFDRYARQYDRDQINAERAKLEESLTHARLAEAMTMPSLTLGPLVVATTALAIDTFVDESAARDRRIAAIEATDVMMQYLPDVWEAVTGQPEMPAVITGQVAAQPKLLQ